MSVRLRNRISLTSNYAARAACAFAFVATVAACNERAPTQPAPTRASPITRPEAARNAAGVPFTIEFYLQAHQDDWQLFLGDRPADAALTANKIVFVYTTAGDAGGAATNPAYWQARETAANASIDELSPVGSWACATVSLNAHAVKRCTKANTVSYYLHLPNPGDASPNGMTGLRDGVVQTLTAVDGSTTYGSWGDLVSTVQTLFATETGTEPDVNVALHAPETDREVNSSDHSDHLATGDLTKTAAGGHSYNAFWYIGYQNQFYPANLTPDQLATKWRMVIAYDNVMKSLMGETIIGTSDAEVWVPRTVYRSEPSSGIPLPPPAPPFAPSALSANSVTGARIDLIWTDNSTDEQGFSVERAVDVDGVAGPFAQIASLAPNARTYSNTGVPAGVRYWYRVAAYNALGSSDYSNLANAILTVPAPPTGLVATAASGVRIDLAWADNSTDESGFRVERAPDVAGVPGSYVQVASVAANVRSYANSGLTAGTPYWYRVRAYNTVGTSSYSEEASATTMSPPVAPSALTATATSGVRIDLAWIDNSADELGFRIERAPDVAGAPGSFAQIASVGANARTYGNTGLANGTRYWYRVRAYNTVGASPYTNVSDATTLRPPAAPSGLAAAAVSTTAIDLTWTDNADSETAYRVERAPDAAGVPAAFTLVTTLGANVTGYRATGLAGGTTYWFRVRAQNAVGNSAFATAASAATFAVIPPSDLAVRSYKIGTQRNADLTWTPGSEATVDIWRNGTKLKSAVPNNGGPYNNTPGATLGTPVSYQVCNIGKAGAANCTLVVNANY